MSWMSTHFVCCEATATGDATLAKQEEILAALVLVQACCDANQVDITDVQTGVDNLEDTLIQPSIC